jgi:hypothetical protein
MPQICERDDCNAPLITKKLGTKADGTSLTVLKCTNGHVQ